MKIRTDFVTNSSSSSFIVSIEFEYEDGKIVEFYREEESSGDVFRKFLSIGDAYYVEEDEELYGEDNKKQSGNLVRVGGSDSALRYILNKLGLIKYNSFRKNDDFDNLLEKYNYENIEKIHYYLEKGGRGEGVARLPKNFLPNEVMKIKDEEKLKKYCAEHDTDVESAKLFMAFLNDDYSVYPDMLKTIITIYVKEKKYEKTRKLLCGWE